MLKLLKFLFGKSKVTHSQYLHSTGLDSIKSEKEFVDCVNLHAFNKELINEIDEYDYYGRVDYGEQGLIAAYECQLEEPDIEEKIPAFLIGTQYFKPKLNVPRNLVDSKVATGFSLGGKMPPIKVPYLEQLATPFLFIATIKSSFPGMDWLPFGELHIIYPLLSTIENYLFIDYSDPTTPKVLEDQLTFHPEKYYGPIPSTGVIEYAQIYLKEQSPGGDLQEEIPYSSHFGHLGIPFWQQDHVLPYCPVSGRLMRFVCGLGWEKSVPLAYTNVDFGDKSKNNNITNLNFWGDGTLYVFMEPQTKIVGMIIQNS
ncbi:hypothetical protein [Neolewinella agarilytica]|uniref:hypothetical protein n=1 Tax=Neolewinella agarilytica TaxID=478744 RepID=UPI00235464D4|nr:hypothetical protein [Neolewinella agarilytica]